MFFDGTSEFVDDASVKSGPISDEAKYRIASPPPSSPPSSPPRCYRCEKQMVETKREVKPFANCGETEHVYWGCSTHENIKAVTLPDVTVRLHEE